MTLNATRMSRSIGEKSRFKKQVGQRRNKDEEGLLTRNTENNTTNKYHIAPKNQLHETTLRGK